MIYDGKHDHMIDAMRYQPVKGQSKKHSMLESVLNVVIGYSIAVCAQALIFPLFGVDVPFTTNMLMGIPFTVVSVVRSYYVRRFFNWLHTKGIL